MIALTIYQGTQNIKAIGSPDNKTGIRQAPVVWLRITRFYIDGDRLLEHMGSKSSPGLVVILFKIIAGLEICITNFRQFRYLNVKISPD